MIWPFKRKPKKLPFREPDDRWGPGDMAECIGLLVGFKNLAPPPAIGHQAMVLDACEGDAQDGTYRGIGLRIMGFPDYWDARGFRKLKLSETSADRKVKKSLPARVREGV